MMSLLQQLPLAQNAQSKTSNINVLVTGAGGPAGINALSMMPAHVKAFGCDCDPAAVDRIRKAGLAPPAFFRVPLAKERGFLVSISGIIRKNKIDVTIPTVDEELSVLSESPVEGVMVSPAKTISTCRDKYALYEMFKEKDFCPEYALAPAAAMPGRVFVKPRTGRGSRNIAAFDSVGEIAPEMLTDDFVACEYLPGTEYTVDAMCGPDGSLLYAVPRVRTEVLRGISVRGKTERRGDILRITEEICKALKFIGPINLQFKLDMHGKPKLTEINPRLSGGLPITAAAGINPIEVLLDVAQGKRVSELKWREVEADNEVMRRLRI